MQGKETTDTFYGFLLWTYGQAKTGASLAIIGKSLNHKSLNATAIYARLDLDPVRESVNTATSAMMKEAGLKKTADVLPLNRKNGAV